VDNGEIDRFLKHARALLNDRGILVFDYEKVSQIAWDVVGTPVLESWKLEDEVLVRVSVGGVSHNVLGSTDVYVVFQAPKGVKSPREARRYSSAISTNQTKVFVDSSFVRFFSLPEIREFARRSGFREVLNRPLPRGRYSRNYAVLRKASGS
jgi:hypothetical protein